MLTIPIQPAQPIVQYRARLSKSDHFNSKGIALTRAFDVLRQDRLNVAKGEPDADDEDEPLLHDKNSRRWLAERFQNLPEDIEQAIVLGTPLVEVTITTESAQVRLLSL